MEPAHLYLEGRVVLSILPRYLAFVPDSFGATCSHPHPTHVKIKQDQDSPGTPEEKKRENRGGKKKRTLPGSPPTSTGVGEAKARLHFLGSPAPERLRSGSEVRGRPPAGALSPAGRVRRAPRDAPAAPPSAAGWNPSQLGRKAVVCFLVERST